MNPAKIFRVNRGQNSCFSVGDKSPFSTRVMLWHRLIYVLMSFDALAHFITFWKPIDKHN